MPTREERSLCAAAFPNLHSQHVLLLQSSVKHTAKYTFIDTFIVFTLHSRMHGVKGV